MNHARPGILDAERTAIRALAFLAGDLEQLERFLSLTGLSPAEVRAAACNPGFLAAVLEHVTQDETLLMTFAANAGLQPESVDAARVALLKEASSSKGKPDDRDDYGW